MGNLRGQYLYTTLSRMYKVLRHGYTFSVGSFEMRLECSGPAVQPCQPYAASRRPFRWEITYKSGNASLHITMSPPSS